jgi:hypothetical protein
MDLKIIYEQVQSRINKIDFQDLWKGFRKYEFALYNDNIVILNGEKFYKTGEFTANTSILYQGRYIAIWYLTKDTDTDELTSKIIHEMFHAYQNQMKDCRFANEFEAISKYQYTPYYLQIKYNENLLLADMLSDFSKDKLSDFLTYRKLRQIEFNYEYNYENSIEAIEGSAQYVEMQALKALNEVKYVEHLNYLIKNICKVEKLIPIRIISYDVGTLFLEVCVRNNLFLDLSICGAKEIFYSQLIKQTPYRKLEIVLKSDVVNFYYGDLKRLKEKINVIISSRKEVIKGNFELLGFNVYSARYLDGYIYSEYFLMYKDNQSEILYGNYLFRFINKRITEIYKDNSTFK